MAQTPGTTDHALKTGEAAQESRRHLLARLLDQPQRFTFFQAIRILERFSGTGPIGVKSLPRQEAIRIRAYDAFEFPASDVTDVHGEANPWRDPSERFVVTATFMGLYGPASPLPSAYTEMIVRPVADEDHEDRQRLRQFLDIIHHRLFSLFYRCQSKYRYHLVFEAGARDRFSGHMLSLIGRGTRGMPLERSVDAVRMIRYAGLLTQYPRSAVGLERVIRDYLSGVAVRLKPCMGRWLSVEDRNGVGRTFCSLGEDMIVGASVYDRTGKFRVSIGPVDLATFKGFLPNGALMEQLRELVRLYLVDELEFDVEVWLQGDQVPSCVVGGTGEPARLGWTSWPVTQTGPDRAVVFRG